MAGAWGNKPLHHVTSGPCTTALHLTNLRVAAEPELTFFSKSILQSSSIKSSACTEFSLQVLPIVLTKPDTCAENIRLLHPVRNPWASIWLPEILQIARLANKLLNHKELSVRSSHPTAILTHKHLGPVWPTRANLKERSGHSVWRPKQ